MHACMLQISIGNINLLQLMQTSLLVNTVLEMLHNDLWHSLLHCDYL